MNRKQTKQQIRQLKAQLRYDSNKTNIRLLKLTALMLILLFLAAVIHGRIQL